MDRKLRIIRKRLKDEFPFYSKSALKIRTKSGEIAPLALNPAQEILQKAVDKFCMVLVQHVYSLRNSWLSHGTGWRVLVACHTTRFEQPYLPPSHKEVGIPNRVGLACGRQAWGQQKMEEVRN